MGMKVNEKVKLKLLQTSAIAVTTVTIVIKTRYRKPQGEGRYALNIRSRIINNTVAVHVRGSYRDLFP
jgi:hypothetical protein